MTELGMHRARGRPISGRCKAKERRSQVFDAIQLQRPSWSHNVGRQPHQGSLTSWTCKEMDAINARRDDGDNINTIIVSAMDMLTGDIAVYTHDVDLELYGNKRC